MMIISNDGLAKTVAMCIRMAVRDFVAFLVQIVDITDKEITSVIPSCINLEVVQLSGIEDTSDQTITILAATATKLCSLDPIGGCICIMDKGVLGLMAKCMMLEWIRLSGVLGIMDSVISALIKSCPRLSKLNLDPCQL